MSESVFNEIFKQSLLDAHVLIHKIRDLPNSPFSRNPKSGHLRGIDFYKPEALIQVIASLIARHIYLYKEKPDLLNPRSFSEKISWSKFFRDFKIPETGNKLLTLNFIPLDLKSHISCPQIVWHSRQPILPHNDQVKAGVYYLKASHGSNMYKRINYPLSKQQRLELEALSANWISREYGIRFGEWFYSAFQRELLLERAVTKAKEPMTFLFYVFSNKIAYIVASHKTEKGERATRYDENFELFEFQYHGEKADFLRLDENVKEALKAFALAIADGSDQVRVDLLVGENNKIYLNELTFTSNDGLRLGDRDFDYFLGEKWALDLGYE